MFYVDKIFLVKIKNNKVKFHATQFIKIILGLNLYIASW